ncbi:GFA family protein [Hyphobacterium lacteum]|uniref:GFA family protein n=1 Tax=Hyphobacterium lacteum TaxID=3116575 RepID=UPI0035A13AD4
MCPKAFGNFFAALVGVCWDDFSWTRGEPATFFSSQGNQRGFCKDCGTPLFFLNDGNEHISMSIGSFDDPLRSRWCSN